MSYRNLHKIVRNSTSNTVSGQTVTVREVVLNSQCTITDVGVLDTNKGRSDENHSDILANVSILSALSQLGIPC